MLYYKTKNTGSLAGLAAILADGKKDMIIWRGNVAHYYDASGNVTGAEERPAHADAADIWFNMPEKDRKNAHRIAAARETIRTKEEKAAAVLDSGRELTAADRAALLALVNVGYHDSGKIEGCYSIDSCAACDFCQRMISAGADNPLIICGSCYAAADAWKEIAWRTHKLNARIFSGVLFTVDELRALAIETRCRFNEDGDTVNEIMARNYIRIASAHVLVMFGYWYKNSPAVEAGLHAEGIHCRADLPKNIRFIHSSLLIGFPAAPTWFDDAIFTVYPDAETTEAAILAGAHECNGRRCRACGFTCYVMQRRESPLHIAEILRCKPARRAVIRAAYDARKALLATA